MGHVADQRGEEHPGAEVEPARRAEPAPQPPADPEQLRQFQQFQQFQEFLKFSEAQKAQEAQQPYQPGTDLTQQPSPEAPQPGQGSLRPSQPPLPQPSHQQLPQPSPQQWLPAQPPQQPPPPKLAVPRWLKRFGAKLLSALLLLIVLLIAGKLAYNHFFGTEDENLPASETGGRKYHATELLSKQPYEAVRKVYAQIAQNPPEPDRACGQMEETTQQRFAENLGYIDCRQAVLGLHANVQDRSEYAEAIPSSVSEPLPQNSVVVSSCRFQVKTGPSLGVFTVTLVDKGQWLITGHEKEPDPCPPKPSAPPSN